MQFFLNSHLELPINLYCNQYGFADRIRNEHTFTHGEFN